MLLNQSAYRIEFRTVESSCLLQSNRVKPKFCNHVFASDMNMRGFTAVQRNKEKTVLAYSQDRRH